MVVFDIEGSSVLLVINFAGPFHIVFTVTGKTIIKDDVNGFPLYFMNGAIYGSMTDYQEDGVRLNAVLPNGRKTASVKTPRDLPLERQSP